jgi:3-phosphoshikimate 1-carboxyvinyltransferase
VKTCLLLAALGAEGEVLIREPAASRDHSERMLRSMGVRVRSLDALTVGLTPPAGSLEPLNMLLPADISAASFLIVAVLLTPGSDLWLLDVGLNPGRTGLLDVLLAMGGRIEVHPKPDQAGEPFGDIHVSHSPLRGTNVSGDLVVRMIDEFPIFAVAAAAAEGASQVRDARELRFKESDRIASLIQLLIALGVQAQESEDGFSIMGGSKFQGGRLQSRGDHRLAMSMAMAGLIAQAPLQIENSEIIAESFPHFADLFSSLGADMETQV